MRYVLPAWDLPSVPVAGDDARFPVRRIFCVGRNYAAHAREMGYDARGTPVFFTKPADAIVPGGGAIPYPSATKDFHHEVELVVALGAGGRDVDAARALELVWGYAVGIDLTRRDLQAAAKKAGQPWDMAKGFDQSAPISPIVPVSRCGHVAHGLLELAVDGNVRQCADVFDMIWMVPEILVELSRLVALAPGDLVYTGTPEGVGPLVRGNVVDARLEGVGELRVTIV